MPESCPKTLEISAFLDEQSSPAERERLDAHLAHCAQCAALLADLRGLSAGLRALPDETLGYDLSEVIRGRLAAAAPGRATPPRRRTWREFLPLGIGATAAVSVGLVMGLALTAASGSAVAPRIAAMAVFDPVAPGGLCIGSKACYAPRGAKGAFPR